MRTWGYGINSIYKTGSIQLEERSVWVHLLDNLADRICSIIPSIKLPPIRIRLFDQTSVEVFNDGKKWTTLSEWYGDLSSLFCCSVHTPISDFCYRHTKSISCEYDYKKLREKFYTRDKKFWDEAEKTATEVGDETG